MTKQLEALLEAGVHFGHQASRWNSKMAPYIYETKNGVHILDVMPNNGWVRKSPCRT